MKRILALFLILNSTTLFAQKIEQRQAIEDLSFLVKQIKTYNAGLNDFQPDFDNLVAAELMGIEADSITNFEYFSHVSRICAFANEGHYKILDLENDLLKGITDNTAAYLPIKTKILSGKVHILGDYSNEQSLNRGDEIMAINGQPMTEIIDQLIPLIPADGSIQTYAIRKIELGLHWQYYFYIDQPTSFEFTLRDSSNQVRTETVTALTRSQQIENIRAKNPSIKKNKASKDEGFYQLELHPDFTYLKLPSFDFRRVNKYEVKSKKLYKTIFSTLKEEQVKTLVVDLRDNTGGRNEFADDMVPFISKTRSSDPYLKKTISWEGKVKVYSLPKPDALAFQGTIYVLVNGKTFSAGGSLARFLKEYGDAIVIGTETGTRYEGFVAGSSEDIRLPNTDLKIGIPRYLLLYPVSKKQPTSNRGLLPDHEVQTTYSDYANGVDVHLEKVKELIDQQ